MFCNGVVAKPKRVQLKTDFKMYQVSSLCGNLIAEQQQPYEILEAAMLQGVGDRRVES